MANLQQHRPGFAIRMLSPDLRRLFMGSPEGAAWPSLYASTIADLHSGEFIGPSGRDQTSGTPKPIGLPPLGSERGLTGVASTV